MVMVPLSIRLIFQADVPAAFVHAQFAGQECCRRAVSMQSVSGVRLWRGVVRDVEDATLHASLRLSQQLHDVDGLIEAAAQRHPFSLS